uniref:Uncharacterized protein n=1 Tax=Salix viminalis TaxID=40686 RepID=A0A6N2N1B1_SALVM
MVEVSVQPDDCTIKSLGIVLVKCGISKKAVGKLGATTKNDYQKGLQAWVLSLSTVADVDDEYDDCFRSIPIPQKSLLMLFVNSPTPKNIVKHMYMVLYGQVFRNWICFEQKNGIAKSVTDELEITLWI